MISALLMLLATIYIDKHSAQTASQHAIKSYGESMSKLTAEQVASSTLRNDSISLQAASRQIIEQSAVTSVIIYDINNNIMTQVSRAKPQDVQSEKYYTSPIVASDNIIGSITLGISAPALIKPQDQGLRLVVSLGLLLIILIAYIKDRQAIHHIAENTNEDTTQENKLDVVIEDKIDLIEIGLLIHINNMNTLYQQLNGESRNQQLKQLDRHIKQAISLYDGKVIAASQDSFLLLFNDDKENCIKHVLYCGELILKLNQQNSKSILTLNGFIQEPKENNVTSSTLAVIRKTFSLGQHYLFIEKSLNDTYELEKYIELDTVQKTHQSMRIKGFTESYRLLLDNQLTQLQKADMDNV